MPIATFDGVRMKLTTVLLRWYKSFNISYKSDVPPRLGAQSRPWNALEVGDDLAEDYSFIGIPIESDITTIVGGNESGKSHLISAISKVLTGKGIDGEEFGQTDLCRYATVPSHEATRWPQIGLSFELDASAEDDVVRRALQGAPVPTGQIEEITLVLGTSDQEAAAQVFFNNSEGAVAISATQLAKLREGLPRVQFLDAEAALPDNLTLTELLSACDPESEPPTRFGLTAAQAAAEFLLEIPSETPNQLSAEQLTTLKNIQSTLVANRSDISADARLAVTLFRDILDVPAEELRQVLDQPIDRRGYTQYFLERWNDRLFERLDLAHFWQQDDQASIKLVYKDTSLYFDITDKTGATYTFKERSSGLRYFLSYYIQAKALERRGRDRNAVILMDEPDCFLSIIGQRNLLAVFESLVGRERAMGKAQLLYTTHSPFLINRNFPRRIRVVVKEEAEEGTQYYSRASARRFEPVRSALGIDTAQTLFMGATNLVLEGLTDQFLLNEMVRALVTTDKAHEFIDLNDVVVVSADGALNIEKVLAASQWGDEPLPATVVVVDGDQAGTDAINSITGGTSGKKKLIEPEFCVQLKSSLHESLSSVQLDTIEDLIPRALYGRAFRKYVERWYKEIFDKHAAKLDSLISSQLGTTKPGIVSSCKSISNEIDGLSEDYDKLGVLEEVLSIVRDTLTDGTKDEDVERFITRMKALYRHLNDTIDLSKQAAARRSMTANVKRLIREFVRVRETGCSVVELRRHLQRLGREAPAQGIGQNLAAAVEALERRVQEVAQSGQSHLVGEEWDSWTDALEKIRRDPLEVVDVEKIVKRS